jgi:cytochrome c-type biogenesis protein CcmH/NrfG
MLQAESMRYSDTLQLVSRCPQRRPAASLPLRLNELFDKLHACKRRIDASHIEDAIWNVWMYDTHEGAELELDRACDNIASKFFDIAETRLARLLRRRPDWPEAWNKLATLLYLMGRDDESVAAIHRTLQIEPRHFGAMCGLGEILRAQGEIESACVAFNTALRVHPRLDGVRRTLLRLRGGDTRH